MQPMGVAQRKDDNARARTSTRIRFEPQDAIPSTCGLTSLDFAETRARFGSRYTRHGVEVWAPVEMETLLTMIVQPARWVRDMYKEL
jgi:hypothetical protein